MPQGTGGSRQCRREGLHAICKLQGGLCKMSPRGAELLDYEGRRLGIGLIGNAFPDYAILLVLLTSHS